MEVKTLILPFEPFEIPECVSAVTKLRVRNFLQKGWGRGYVGVPAGHPWFGLGREDIPAGIHGGLTYAADRSPGQLLPDGLWWVGFDSSHYGDNQQNWPRERVLEETEILRRQAVDFAALELNS